MDIAPYSIYYEHRPFRIAFLVDENNQTDLIDKIVEYNRNKWGGRYNPIIFTDGNTIDENWWKFLRDYDPDIIYCTKKISDGLRERIQIFLTPLSVETIRDEAHPTIHIDDDPISILPSRNVVSSISGDLFDRESDLILFELDEVTPNSIKQFINRNFGNYETGQQAPFHLKKVLESCKTITYKIKDFTTLNDTLLELSDYKNRYVFPAQICSEVNHMKETEYNYKLESFEVIVGDSNAEISYCWNRVLNIKYWLRQKVTQLWIPSEMIMEPAVKDGLAKFINRCTGSIGNNDHHQVNYATFSLDEAKIKEIADYFNGTTYYPKSSIKYTTPQLPEFSKHSRLFMMRRGLDFIRANSLEEHIVIDEPKVEEGGMGGQHWFTDFYIEYRPERDKTIIGKDSWWQLPKRNALLSNLQFFNKSARINELGMFSVLMKRKSNFDPDEATVVIQIPTDEAVFANLICGESYKNINTDPRQTFLSRPYYTTRTSDMGKPLRGILNLFPDLHGAYHLIQERYVRNIFNLMSNKRSEKDEELVKQLASEFKKKINAGTDLNSEEGLKWLAEKSIKTSKVLGNKEKSLLFSEFLTEANRETEEYNTANKSNQFTVDEEDLKEKLTDLIESNILLTGIEAKCSRCGEKNWYHINEISQEVVCHGCKYEFVIPAEQKWSYKLNSMVRDAFVEYGTIPVLLVLGQLFMDARTSFMFVPCADLITKTEDGIYKLETDLDIACIVDGEFVIGEIKQSIDGFKQSDFDKIEVAAKSLKPDRIVFSSLDKSGSYSKQLKKNMNSRISKLQDSLKDLEVKVEWYHIHDYIFEASPVR